jgi:hypothetical protein
MALLCAKAFRIVNKLTIVSTLMPPAMVATAPPESIGRRSEDHDQRAATGENNFLTIAHVRDAQQTLSQM